jgi:hypothetical protein
MSGSKTVKHLADVAADPPKEIPKAHSSQKTHPQGF